MKFRNLFSLLLATTLLFAACEKGTEDTDKTPEKPDTEQPGNEQPGDEKPGDEPEDKEPVLTLTSEATLEFAAEGGNGEISYTLENPKEGVNVTATCEAAWVTDVTVADKVTFAVAVNEGDAREAKVVVSYEEQSFEVAVKQAAKVADDPEVPEGVTVVSAVATKGSTGGDMNYHSVAFTLSNSNIIAIEFRTDGNDYLTVGKYTDSWSDWKGNGGTVPGYIGYAYYNGEAAYWVSTNVAYENDAYTVVFEVSADGENIEEYTYTGAIEGLGAPVVGEEEEGKTYNYTLTSVDFDNKTYGDVNFKNGDDVYMRLCINPLANNDFVTATYTKADLDLVNSIWNNIQMSGMADLGDVNVDITAANGVVTAATATVVKGADTHIYTFVATEGGGDDTVVATEWVIDSVEWGYISENYNDIVLRTATVDYEFNSVTLELKASVTDNKLPDGIYTSEDGGILLNYCKQLLDGDTSALTSAQATITNNADGTTTIDALWTSNNISYKATWSGTLPEYEL